MLWRLTKHVFDLCIAGRAPQGGAEGRVPGRVDAVEDLGREHGDVVEGHGGLGCVAESGLQNIKQNKL